MQSDKPTILLVEDDDLSADIVHEMLSEDFIFLRASDGVEALRLVKRSTPEIVLLDVMMPGIDGYEVCRRLRDDPELAELPILFLSGKVSNEERLAGYEAGGDDYLAKPVIAQELRTKIKKALAQKVEREELKSTLSSAFATAMTAMSTASEVGTVLQFLRTSFQCLEYTSLAMEIINACSTYGLDSSVQVRGANGVVSLNAHGPCSPLEENILTNMSKQGRLFEFGPKTSCSYERVTIIIHNMPRQDADRYGRMKDNIALLAEGGDARMRALDDAVALKKQKDSLDQLLVGTHQALKEVELLRRFQQTEGEQLAHDFDKSLNRLLLTLGLTPSQEEELLDLTHQLTQKMKTLHEASKAVEERIQGLLNQLDARDQKSGHG